MPAKGPRVHSLTVLLLGHSIAEPEDALKKPEELTRYELRADLDFTGMLFLRDPQAGEPSWKRFVEPGLVQALPPLANASNSAVLFVRTGGRILAITFGHGRHLLKTGVHETDFGLKVVLNSVDEKKLRSIDVHRFEELAL